MCIFKITDVKKTLKVENSFKFIYFKLFFAKLIKVVKKA
jgi:hypothetical protein